MHLVLAVMERKPKTWACHRHKRIAWIGVCGVDSIVVIGSNQRVRHRLGLNIAQMGDVIHLCRG